MKHSRGFSLVELMVAVALALVVTAGVLSVFIGSRSSFQATSGIAALSDSGRFALNFLGSAVRGAGYLACGGPNRTTSGLNAQPTPLDYAPGPSGQFQPLTGFEGVNTSVGNTYAASTILGGAANWNPNLDAAFASLAIPAGSSLPVKNNDILVIRSSTLGSQPSYVSSYTDGVSNFTVDAKGSLVTGQLAAISNCGQARLFQITNVSAAAPGFRIDHSVGGTPGNAVAIFPAGAFAVGSLVQPISTTAFYIGVGADGDGALFSADVAPNNTLTGTELVPGIEAMQVLYGYDAAGAQTVSQYVTADQVVDFTSVMSVQVAVLAAGPPGSVSRPIAAPTYSLLGTLVTAPMDTRARQVFQSTIAVRNALP